MKKLAVAIAIALLFWACRKKDDPNCGYRPDDWCAAPPGDPCGKHSDEKSCRADPQCEGREYRGESVVACIHDDRCFGSNCPTVGCLSRCEALAEAECAKTPRCTVTPSRACARKVPCVVPPAPDAGKVVRCGGGAGKPCPPGFACEMSGGSDDGQCVPRTGP